jgi:hypothetical protein
MIEPPLYAGAVQLIVTVGVSVLETFIGYPGASGNDAAMKSTKVDGRLSPITFTATI